MGCLCGLLKVRLWMALNFLKWNSNTADEYVFKVAVLGGMDSDSVIVLRIGASPLLWGSDGWPDLSVHRPSTIICSDPNCLQNFRLRLDPELHFELCTPTSHPIPMLSLPLAWLSKCKSHSLFAGSQAATASAITQNCEQMSRLLTWTVLNHYITLVKKITALAPHKILHPLLGLAPELLDLLTCSSLPKRAACAS